VTDFNVTSSEEVQSPLPETNSLGKPTTKLIQDWAEDLGQRHHAAVCLLSEFNRSRAALQERRRVRFGECWKIPSVIPSTEAQAAHDAIHLLEK
jgi:hypothetical protein